MLADQPRDLHGQRAERHEVDDAEEAKEQPPGRGRRFRAVVRSVGVVAAPGGQCDLGAPANRRVVEISACSIGGVGSPMRRITPCWW